MIYLILDSWVLSLLFTLAQLSKGASLGPPPPLQPLPQAISPCLSPSELRPHSIAWAQSLMCSHSGFLPESQPHWELLRGRVFPEERHIPTPGPEGTTRGP